MEEKGLLILASTFEAAMVVLTHNNKQKLEKDGEKQLMEKGGYKGILSKQRLNDKEEIRKLLRINTETFQVYAMTYYIFCNERYEQQKQMQAGFRNIFFPNILALISLFE